MRMLVLKPFVINLFDHFFSTSDLFLNPHAFLLQLDVLAIESVHLRVHSVELIVLIHFREPSLPVDLLNLARLILVQTL